MNSAIRETLARRGYRVNDRAYEIIRACDDWYRLRATDRHRRVSVGGDAYQLERMGFGQRAAADDANLCELLEVRVDGAGRAIDAFVRAVLRDNQFDVQYRKQLELVSAEGSAACYVWVEGADALTNGGARGGRLRLHYVEAAGFVPLTVRNDEVIEAAFLGEALVGTRCETTLVLCTLDEAGRYRYEVSVYDELGRPLPGRARAAQLGRVRPFAVLRNACVNPLPDMEGFGYPKLYGVIPILHGLDAAYTALLGDLETAEKITLLNEAICGFGEDGRPLPPNEQLKRRFVFLGEKLPQADDIVHEITPAIRVEAFREVVELLLSLLAQQFGFGTKKYAFDPHRGTLMTATQYVGERQDMLQELNRQRCAARGYIAELVRAVLWFANAFLGASWDVEAQVSVEFDDAFIMNRAEELREMRADVQAGIGGLPLHRRYLMRKYGIDEREAARWTEARADSAEMPA